MSEFHKDLRAFCQKYWPILAFGFVIALVMVFQVMTIHSMTEFLEDHNLYDDYSNYNP